MPTSPNPDITERDALEKALSDLVNNIHPSQETEDLFGDDLVAQESLRAPVANMLTPEAVLHDATASFWLKDALRAALKRDAVDAARDAGVLARVLEGHADRKIVEARFAQGHELGHRDRSVVNAYLGMPAVAGSPGGMASPAQVAGGGLASCARGERQPHA